MLEVVPTLVETPCPRCGAGPECTGYGALREVPQVLFAVLRCACQLTWMAGVQIPEEGHIEWRLG